MVGFSGGVRWREEEEPIGDGGFGGEGFLVVEEKRERERLGLVFVGNGWKKYKCGPCTLLLFFSENSHPIPVSLKSLYRYLFKISFCSANTGSPINSIPVSHDPDPSVPKIPVALFSRYR